MRSAWNNRFQATRTRSTVFIAQVGFHGRSTTLVLMVEPIHTPYSCCHVRHLYLWIGVFVLCPCSVFFWVVVVDLIEDDVARLLKKN